MSTNSPVPLPAQPTPLSPDQFTGSGGANGTTTATGTPAPEAPLTASDLATLQAALELLKAARANMASADQNLKAAGQKQVAALNRYLIGFCDGRGLIEDTPPVKPGFESLFGDYAKPDLDTALAQLDAALTGALAAGETRMSKETIHAIGDACLAVGGALLGAGLAVLI